MKHLGKCYPLLVMGLVSSCIAANPGFGTWKENTEEYFNATVERVSLAFNLSKNNQNGDVSSDYREICQGHSLFPSANDYRGEITDLTKILVNENFFDENRKPSITVLISGISRDTTKVFTKEEVGQTVLCNIPRLKDFRSSTLTIKSLKTESGLQIVWEKKNSGPEWPNVLIIDGEIKTESEWDSESLSVVVKSGTNNANGDFAVRPNGEEYDIIPNTVEDQEDVLEAEESVDSEIDLGDYCEVEDPMISPTLLRSIYSGGCFRNDLRWKAPVILTRNEEN